MREITYGEAAIEAIGEEMEKDDRIFYMGEDVGRFGGSYGTTKGLWERFGDDRVKDTPMSEAAMVGYALGAAITGMRPVVEIMFVDLLCLAMDQIVNQVAKIHYMFGGKAKVPLVIRVPFGGLRRAAGQHSQHLEAWFLHTPGLKIVVPSDPYHVKGLLKTAIRENNPVMCLEHILLYQIRGGVPEGDYTLPIGKAQIKREGKDVTVVSYSLMLHRCLSVAEKLHKQGIEVEVIDLGSLHPLDMETVVASVKKTNRVAIVHQACLTGGVGAEVGIRITEAAFDYLDAPVKRIAARDVPVPFSPVLEDFVVPTEERIEGEIKGML
ncbi:alpha-ketoacid dehydrogenase subunit beta [Candidatus Aerophobetes bacterium]|uniref:Alpha-ketoacid dehydrogenase subunit beta n=1 Tax=Aerophobetes bacterium TaxID=2030807 RepID=A0A523T981_UNCAE|nr:MAG: alpha-ketoacid dehydrogenase subunit beta [Candidatus Aerophobetes bacterium]